MGDIAVMSGAANSFSNDAKFMSLPPNRACLFVPHINIIVTIDRFVNNLPNKTIDFSLFCPII